MLGGLHSHFHLDRDIPLTAVKRHGGVFDLPLDITALDVGNPTNFWQVDLLSLSFDTLRIAKSLVPVFRLEFGKTFGFLKTV
jgi:hypothetical protein